MAGRTGAAKTPPSLDQLAFDLEQVAIGLAGTNSRLDEVNRTNRQTERRLGELADSVDAWTRRYAEIERGLNLLLELNGIKGGIEGVANGAPRH